MDAGAEAVMVVCLVPGAKLAVAMRRLDSIPRGAYAEMILCCAERLRLALEQERVIEGGRAC